MFEVPELHVSRCSEIENRCSENEKKKQFATSAENGKAIRLTTTTPTLQKLQRWGVQLSGRQAPLSNHCGPNRGHPYETLRISQHCGTERFEGGPIMPRAVTISPQPIKNFPVCHNSTLCVLFLFHFFFTFELQSVKSSLLDAFLCSVSYKNRAPALYPCDKIVLY